MHTHTHIAMLVAELTCGVTVIVFGDPYSTNHGLWGQSGVAGSGVYATEAI